MCGIAGIIGSLPNKHEVMDGMLKKQHHRGPDANGQWQDTRCCLGHNRLSIIDLSADANQPMLSHDSKYIIVFNGEIYNYKELKALVSEYPFKTHSDTEVLLALYHKLGKDMLSHLNGMFALAIWDTIHQKLFVARDRFGVKPFYYAFANNVLYFSSEIKTLWAAGIEKVKNEKVWANYLVYGTYGMPNETFWDGIHQLPAGHYAEYEPAQTELSPILWYDFVTHVNNTPLLSYEELKQRYLALLIDSIQLRFRADVPVGFNISGGLDSSTLLALVNQSFPNNSTIEAFTFYCNDSRYDELPWVEKMINKTQNPLNKVLLEANDIESLMEEVSYFQDEPFGGFPTLAYSLIFKAARKKGILVLLDGQGMDEAWAGYDYYQTNTGHTIQGTTSSPVRPEVLTEAFRNKAVKDIYPEPFDNTLQNLQYRDLFYTKIPRALRFNDRISMMYSTELREPFLDYRLVELAFAQPETMKIHNGQSKWMLREIVKDLLGDGIALAPKRPLQTPQREWMAEELKEFINKKINSFASNPLVIKENILKIYSDYTNGDSENSFYLWQWINCNELLKYNN